ncbi:MAG: hypothetical protein H0W42_10185 [Gemmatimonadaceae bacterium]|nr:hypothetical protein [Gemmatimonadaceae bacterium]
MSGAQDRAPAAVDFASGGELENYLRVLQISGKTAWYPWSLRSFSGRELQKLLPSDTASLPWRLSSAKLTSRVAVGSVDVRTVLNSAFPYGSNDGAVWAGRGLTTSASASVTARVGPVSLTLAPLAFIATNAAFPLLDNGQTGSLSYNDGLFADRVDHPQRFGDGPHGRGDPGASEIRLDTRFVTAGFGTAPMSWGPASSFPFLLGTNAAGFPHAFLGTGEPVNIWLGKTHVRAMWGKLSQSSYSPVTGSDNYLSDAEPGRDRLMTGIVLIFTPRPIPHLEVGVARFAHVANRVDGITSDFIKSVWPTFLKKNVYRDPDVETGNELASFFARWAFPTAGFELFAEHGHDDWYHDLRDLTQEPDHNRSYSIGFQKTFDRSARRLDVLRGELINYQMPPLGRDRPGQGFIYSHNFLRQGHTQRGQLLGSSAGVGSASASLLAWDRYAPSGRTTLSWRRTVRGHIGTFYLDGSTNDKSIDVIHSLGAERSRGNAKLRYTLGVDLMANLNRHFTSDVFNFNARAGMEWSP